MRTHRHREGNITYQDLLGGAGARGGIAGGRRGWVGLTLEKIPNEDEEGTVAANHHGMCIPM